ncbi:DUF3624 family protein [Mesorhizobium abyssinicae]|uniref:DUF3624 family protein n=1 Tax=Mesorhizobium abyssinicae TaxID=1209958 RepID=UPI00387DD24C
MKKCADILTRYAWGKLGNCSKCVRTSLWVALGLWLFSMASPPGSTAFLALCIVASAASLLWLAHIMAYAIKAKAADSDRDPVDLSRRSAMSLARQFAFALIVTSVPSRAFAMGSCGSCPQPVADGDCYRDDYNGGCARCRSCGNNCGDVVC